MRPCWASWPRRMARPLMRFVSKWPSVPMPAAQPMMRRFQAGWRRLWAIMPRGGTVRREIWRKACAMVKTRINLRRFMWMAATAPGWPLPFSIRAKSCRTTISTTPMPPLSWPANLTLPTGPLASLSNTPTPAVWRAAIALRRLILRHLIATAPVPLAASLR